MSRGIWLPDEVQELWQEKLASMSRAEAPDLPRGTLLPAIFEGLHADQRLVSAVEWLIETYPREIPLDVGAAQCDRLNRELLDGGRALRGLPAQVAFASMIATDESLIYVMPALGLHRRWPWRQSAVMHARKVWRFSGVEVAMGTERFKVSMGASAAANVTYLHSWANRRRAT